MTRPIVIEAQIHVETGKLWWQYVCVKCNARGALVDSLNKAEADGTRHNRVAHAEIPSVPSA